MKYLSILFLLTCLSVVSFAQNIYQIRADSVRIYNVCDTAELILENRTQNTMGYLFNKGKGRTEFKKISLKQVGPSRIAIIGQDTLDVSTLSGVGIDTMYRNGNNITYVKNSQVYNIPAPLPAETLQSVTDRGFVTTNDIHFNKANAFPSNGLMWGYNSDTWKIFVESQQDDPSGNLIFQAADNNTEGWIFRNVGGGTNPSTILPEVLSIGRLRFLYNGNAVWHAGNHVPGVALTPVLTGASVLSGLTTNASGHVTAATTRTLTPADIAAAPLKGSAWYIQTQQDSAQTANFFVAGTGSVTKLKTFNVPGESQYELYGGTRDIRDIKNRRWSFSLKGTEDAGLSGSDFFLNRHDALGNVIDTPLKVTRNSGVVDMSVGGFIAASSSRIRGIGAGNANTSYLSFVEKDGSTRSGYVGKVSSVNGDVSLLSDKGNISLGAVGGGQFLLAPTFLRLTSGVISLVNTNYNVVNFDTAGISAPAMNVSSIGTKLLLNNRATTTSTNFAIGVDSGATWFSVPQSVLNYSWKYYGGTTMVSRLTALGHQEWNGQGRFKGWLAGNNDPSTGPAAEIGYANSAATMIGFDRTANTYIKLRLMGGNTLNTPLYFEIDGTGYKFTNLPNASILSTDANGYLVKSLTVSVPTVANTVVQRDASGNINATGFLQNSRAALKKDIRDFNEDALSLLMKVQIKQFTYKDDQQENIRVGIIADSTDWHFSTRHHDKFDTNSSLAITMKALQEMNEQYQLLKNENEAIKAENKDLTNKLEALLKRVDAIEQQQKNVVSLK
ncbi:tail fiber domain-containing protein [Chitinophaga sp. CC14]|uniref:tail fiber domain-containing protein n=1 Tax=Chitinophaga sp. CC14 TaxID=3029199 RepID=UPI003B7DB35F